MLFEISIFFILFSLASICFLLISGNTQNLRASDAERLDILNDFIMTYVVPVIIVGSVFLFPAVIVCGV